MISVDGPVRRAAVLDRGAGRDRRRGPSARPARRHPLPRRHRRERRTRRRHRLHRARLHDHRRHHPAVGRHRDVPRLDQRADRELGRVAPPPEHPGQGRRGVPEGEGVAVQGDRGRREDRVRQRRAGIWHGRNAEELVVLVKRGMTPLQAIRAATTVSADLIEAPDLGRIAPEMLADIIGVPDDPLADITATQQVGFVMKGGQVYKRPPA